MEQQIAELAKLRAGWLNGEGQALDAAGLRWAAQVLAQAMEAGAPPPYLYPTVEGHLQAEWSIGSWGLSATFDLTWREAEVFAVDTAGHAEATMLLDRQGASERLCGLLRACA